MMKYNVKKDTKLKNLAKEKNTIKKMMIKSNRKKNNRG